MSNEPAAAAAQSRPVSPMQVTITIEQMCDLMSIGRTSGYNLVNTPGFPKLNIGRKVLIPYRQLVEWTEKNIGNSINV